MNRLLVLNYLMTAKNLTNIAYYDIVMRNIKVRGILSYNLRRKNIDEVNEYITWREI